MMSTILAHASLAHLELALFAAPAVAVGIAIVRELRRRGPSKEMR
jgi:hypothetical protein